MTERTIKPSQGAYKREVLYMEGKQEQDRVFKEMLSTVPEENEEVRETMKSLWNTKLGKLFDQEKLVRLEEENKPLFREVITYSMNYLKGTLE